jgi:hypothetical protein
MLRRIMPIGFVVVGVAMLVAVAASLLFPTAKLPSSRLVGWQLADGFLGTPRFDPQTAQATTVVQISVDWLSCAPHDDSWLAPPEVESTPWSVTITMHTTDAFAASACGRSIASGNLGIMLDVGIPVAVQLREPLGDRPLFAGSSRSPLARPYPRP